MSQIVGMKLHKVGRDVTFTVITELGTGIRMRQIDPISASKIPRQPVYSVKGQTLNPDFYNVMSEQRAGVPQVYLYLLPDTEVLVDLDELRW